MSGDAEAFREAIIGASLELGQACGEDGVTMRAIASKLGTSATTLYTCFESKAAIMRELRIRGAQILGRALITGFSAESAGAGLIEGSRAFLRFARENPWLYGLLVGSEAPLAEVLTESQQAGVERLSLEVRAVFGARRLEAGAPGDSNESFVRWFTAMHGLAALLINRRFAAGSLLRVEDFEAFAARYIEAAVGCILPKQG